MPWVRAHNFPFRHYQPGASADVAEDMQKHQRDPAYLKAVLENVRKLAYR